MAAHPQVPFPQRGGHQDRDDDRGQTGCDREGREPGHEHDEPHDDRDQLQPRAQHSRGGSGQTTQGVHLVGAFGQIRAGPAAHVLVGQPGQPSRAACRAARPPAAGRGAAGRRPAHPREAVAPRPGRAAARGRAGGPGAAEHLPEQQRLPDHPRDRQGAADGQRGDGPRRRERGMPQFDAGPVRGLAQRRGQVGRHFLMLRQLTIPHRKLLGRRGRPGRRDSHRAEGAGTGGTQRPHVSRPATRRTPPGPVASGAGRPSTRATAPRNTTCSPGPSGSGPACRA